MQTFSQFTSVSFSVPAGQWLPATKDTPETPVGDKPSYSQAPAATSFLDLLERARDKALATSGDSLDWKHDHSSAEFTHSKSMGTTADGGYDFSQVPRGSSYLDYINHLRHGGRVATMDANNSDFDIGGFGSGTG